MCRPLVPALNCDLAVQWPCAHCPHSRGGPGRRRHRGAHTGPNSRAERGRAAAGELVRKCNTLKESVQSDRGACRNYAARVAGHCTGALSACRDPLLVDSGQRMPGYPFTRVVGVASRNGILVMARYGHASAFVCAVIRFTSPLVDHPDIEARRSCPSMPMLVALRLRFRRRLPPGAIPTARAEIIGAESAESLWFRPRRQYLTPSGGVDELCFGGAARRG